MLNYLTAIREAIRMKAGESGFPPESLSRPGVHLYTLPPAAERAAMPVRRYYPPRDPDIIAISFGRGTAVLASRDIVAAVKDLLRDAERDDVFEAAHFAAMSVLLAPHGRRLRGPYLRLLCGADTLRERPVPPKFAIWLEAAPALERLRALDPACWPHAVSLRHHEAMPIMAVAVAIAADGPAGVAAVGADSEHLWQVGIDVAAEHRGRGLGAALTSALARFTLDQGTAPYHGVAPANLASMGAALAAGFRPAWVETYTADAAP